MKKLISLISTEGKTREQIVMETWNAFQKYNLVKTEQSKLAGEKEDSKAMKKPTEL